MDVCVF